ncbi:PGF-CTERM sorting domain-containing protein [Haloarcula hispanica]|uniref:PGF-CTERM sorting domain-containing protein n=1 Tax=Haloarcula hispanica TaxID=51589 RepID=A0A482T5E9_HALHI|nr:MULTISPECIES: PGF-CTERM sorting domain-containing protein [Haloarcula]KAA9407172.1 PGF-CTERM sorting domain-containing protein [Haloarcula sp. CBA1131]KAA9409790.1 PGF-CTERM sorting domain-containing protein [Haloarcula hispanica]MCJ0620284.1 PGF-CTERM sorting domain-containing protein [Haloarcula hispanica]RYJ10696.1 PGF-CTERM sorting domain-containing protein [Haloarcula hispanica]
MRRETLLTGGVVVVVLTMLIGATAVPGALSEPQDDVRESYLDLRETTIEPASVDGQTVTLSIDARLSHRGGPAENVTVETRAIDADTGLVATTTRQSVGTIEGEREVSVRSNITVERAGGYRIDTIVYEDGDRVETGQQSVQNVDALTPAYARSSVTFQRFENAGVPLDSITYRIDGVSDNRTTLNVSVYVTNAGNDPSDDLSLRLRARQADSNVIADESTVRVGQIRPGRTEIVRTQLTVPDGYNYWLDGMLLSDGVIVGTESSPANLHPTERLQENETRQEVGFQSSDFEQDRPEGQDMDEPQQTMAEEGPGFTALAGLIAVLASALLIARRQTNE